jgi:hypothetical protein
MQPNDDPEAIRREIEQTRERMGDTVQALAYKADVPARAKGAVQDRVDAVKGAVANVAGKALSRFGSAQSAAASAGSSASTAVGDAVAQAKASLPSTDQVKAKLSQAGSTAVGNPLGLAIGAVAVGFIAGLLVPVSDLERDRLGPIGEQLADKAKATAGDLIEHGKSAVTDALGGTG